jgi:hypothetical protein
MVNLAFRSTILLNPDLVDLECLGNFWWIQAPESECDEFESLPNMPYVYSFQRALGGIPRARCCRTFVETLLLQIEQTLHLAVRIAAKIFSQYSKY